MHLQFLDKYTIFCIHNAISWFEMKGIFYIYDICISISKIISIKKSLRPFESILEMMRNPIQQDPDVFQSIF